MSGKNKLSISNSRFVSRCKIFSIFPLLWGLNLSPESWYVHHLASRIFPTLPFPDFLIGLAFSPDVLANESLRLVSLLSSPHLCSCNSCLQHSPFLLAVQTSSVHCQDQLQFPPSLMKASPDLSGLVAHVGTIRAPGELYKLCPRRPCTFTPWSTQKGIPGAKHRARMDKPQEGEFKEVRSEPQRLD